MVRTGQMSDTATRRYQTFSTTVSDPDSGLSATFVVYPASPRVVPFNPPEEALWRARTGNENVWARSLPLERVPLVAWPPLDMIASDPGWERPPQRLSTDPDVEFPFKLAAVISSDRPDARDVDELREDTVSAEVFGFSHYLVHEPLIPFRNSPLTAQALGQLIGQSSGVASGAVAGAWAGSDHGFIMLATVPGGMIVGGAAFGVGMALQQGLHDRILKWISGPTPPGEQKQA